VPIQRSATAFARGARIGVRMMPDVGAGEYRVEGGGELAVPVADQEAAPVGFQNSAMRLTSGFRTRIRTR
jgi:hypothetical protein